MRQHHPSTTYKRTAQAHEYKKKEIQKQTNQKIENSSTSKEISELSSLNDGRAPAFLKKRKEKK
jgi:hypothetical protein